MKIWHNPRCSKSRQTLALIQEKGIEPEIYLYLEASPTGKDIADVIDKLGIEPRALLRKGEEAYKSCGLADTSLSDKAIIDAMASHPKLIERPVVISGNKAVLGRPPENVLTLF